MTHDLATPLLTKAGAMGYYSKSANRYVSYDLDDLVTETVKTNEHQKIANYLEVLKIENLPADVVSAISAQIISYVRTNTAN